MIVIGVMKFCVSDIEIKSVILLGGIRIGHAMVCKYASSGDKILH